MMCTWLVVLTAVGAPTHGRLNTIIAPGRPAAAAKLLALIAPAILPIAGTEEVASHTVSLAHNRLFDQIAEDLKPFAAGISLQQVERAFCAGGTDGGFRYKAVLSVPPSAAHQLELTSACGGLPAPCMQPTAMCLQVASLWRADVCCRRTQRLPVEEQAGTSDTGLAFCLAAAMSSGHQSWTNSAGIPNCSCCVRLPVSHCQTLTLAGSTLVGCMSQPTAAK